MSFLGNLVRGIGHALSGAVSAVNPFDDEEQRRKRQQAAAQQAAQRSSASQGPSLSVQPAQNPTQFDMTKPLVKAASQSDAMQQQKLKVAPVVPQPSVQVTSGPADQPDTPHPSFAQNVLKLAKKAPGAVVHAAGQAIDPVVQTIASPVEQVIGLTEKDPIKRQAILDDAARRNPIAQSGGSLSDAAVDVQHHRNPTTNLVKSAGTAVNLISSALPFIGFGKKQAGEALVKATARSAGQNALLGGTIAGSQSASQTGDLKKTAEGFGKGALFGGVLGGVGEVAMPLLRKAVNFINPAQKIAEEAPKIAGVTKGVNTAPAEPSVEIGSGIKSTNLVKARQEQIAAQEAEQAATKTGAMAETPAEVSVAEPAPVEAPPKISTEPVAPEAAPHMAAPIDVPVPERAPTLLPATIPDVRNPIALAKADPGAAVAPSVNQAANDVPMADFSKAINAPLRKAEATATPGLAPTEVPPTGATPPRIETNPAPQVDAAGNPVLLPDAERARQLAAEGVVPGRGDSPVAATEAQLAQGADQAAQEQIRNDGPAGFVVNDAPQNLQIGREIRRIDKQLEQVRQGISTLSPEDVRGLVQRRTELVTEAIHPSPAAPAPEPSMNPTVANDAPDLTGAAAPNTRTQITNRISDDEVRADLNQNVPMREQVSLADAENNAKAVINDMSDDQLIGRFAGDVKVNDPESWYANLNAIKRLEAIGSPEARAGIRNALDAMAEYSSASGRGLRTVQTVFEDMPSSMKVEYLTNKLAKAGVDLPDDMRAILDVKIQKADAAADNLRNLEDEAMNMMHSGQINNASIPPEVAARVGELSNAIKSATREKEMLSGDAWRFYNDQLPPHALGERAAEVGRTLMLSAPSGRVFDVASTFTTAADDILNRGVSSLVGKAVNLVKGRGAVDSTLPSASQLVKGGVEGARDTIDHIRGNGRVENFMSEAGRPSRGEIGGNSGTRRLIRGLVELPTGLTKGIQNDALYRSGMQEAAQQGLKGDAQQLYAHLRAAVPDEQVLHQASQEWRRANMLHDNAVSRGLNKVMNALGSDSWGGLLIKNQIAPFTSWLGGNLHRALTDKNVLWNVGSAVMNTKRGNLQGVVNDLSKLAVNTGEAYAAGFLLSKAGVLTTTDANGDSYGGVYFHVGDRYIPAAIAGTLSVPLILGNAVHQGLEKGDGKLETIVDEAGKNMLKNAGVASVFGGDNTLQKAVSDATSEGGDLFKGAAEYAGGLVRQFVPGVTGDVNAVLDQTALNPTHEAPNTKVTAINPDTGREKTQVGATEIAKTIARIPFAAQALPRKEGELAKDLVDRITHGNHATGTQEQQKQEKESLGQMESRLRKEGVPLKDDDIKGAMDDGDYEKAQKGLEYKLAKAEADSTTSDHQKDRIRDQIAQTKLQSQGVPVDDKGIKARTEDGNYDAAMKGLQYQLDKASKDKNTPKSDREKIQKDITRLKVSKSGQYSPATLEMYDKTSLSEWRALGNPESEDYDPDLYNELWAYDSDLAKAGVSKSTKDGSKQKFSAAKGRGSGSGGRGGGPNMKGFTTSIATQDFEGSKGFSPQKALAANFATPDSAIPVISPVPNYDTSKLKKISVSKGGSAS